MTILPTYSSGNFNRNSKVSKLLELRKKKRRASLGLDKSREKEFDQIS